MALESVISFLQTSRGHRFSRSRSGRSTQLKIRLLLWSLRYSCIVFRLLQRFQLYILRARKGINCMMPICRSDPNVSHSFLTFLFSDSNAITKFGKWCRCSRYSTPLSFARVRFGIINATGAEECANLNCREIIKRHDLIFLRVPCRCIPLRTRRRKRTLGEATKYLLWDFYNLGWVAKIDTIYKHPGKENAIGYLNRVELISTRNVKLAYHQEIPFL